MAEWRIRRRAESCGMCERAFEEGERYVSAVTIDEEEIAREDACSACWAGRTGSEDDELFFWFTRHRPDRKRSLELDMGSLEALFEKLAERKEKAARELRFVLCLLLMRKRRLKLVKVVRGSDGEAMMVRKPRRQDSVRVHVFDFTPERLAELKNELREVFEGADPADLGSERAERSGDDGSDDGASDGEGPPEESNGPQGRDSSDEASEGAEEPSEDAPRASSEAVEQDADDPADGESPERAEALGAQASS